jgi:RNA recognition motif-containing protein
MSNFFQTKVKAACTFFLCSYEASKGNVKEQWEQIGKFDSTRSVFVGGLPLETTEEDLTNHFVDCGNIQQIILPTFKLGENKRRGFGFIEFYETESAQKALAKDGSMLNENVISVAIKNDDVKRFVEEVKQMFFNFILISLRRKHQVFPSLSRNTSKKLSVYVINIGEDTDSNQLSILFGGCGEISHISIPPKRGYAFVNFTTQEAVETALKLDGSVFKGRTINVEKTKNEKRDGADKKHFYETNSPM